MPVQTPPLVALVSPPPRPRGRWSLLPYWRALRLRCPACGGGPVFVSWFRMCPNCPACGFHFDREVRGYWLGSYTVNLMATEAVFAIVLVAVLFATWPSPPWDLLQYGSGALMIVVPFLFFPFSRTLYLAIDLTFRPDEPEDFDTPHEAGLNVPRHQL